jgi:hypothetical protein
MVAMRQRQRLLLCIVISIAGLACALYGEPYTALGAVVKYPLSGALVGIGVGVLARYITLFAVAGTILGLFMALLL